MARNVLAAAAVLAAGYAARRYYRNWGTTKDESRMTLPGDRLVGSPVAQTTEGIWIDAPPEAVWPWLVQMGQDRGGLQHLVPGDVVHLAPRGWPGVRGGLALPVVEVIDQKSLVLHGTPPDVPQDVVWSFHLIPRGDDRCRLLVRTRTRLRYPGEFLALELASPVKAFITRGMLRGIKRRVEAARSTAGAVARTDATQTG